MNSTGPKPAQAAQLPAEARPRAPARWRLCRKDPEFLTNWEQVILLFNQVTDHYKNTPAFLPIHDWKSTTPFKRGRAPASIYAGRLGQRQGSLSSGHEISTTPTISPNIISLMVTRFGLATTTVDKADQCMRSRRFMAV
jgi:hypothetical protein